MNFNAPYNRSDALAFLDRFLPDDFAAAAERVKLEFDHDHITEVFKIGHAPALDLPVYEIHHTSENDPRVSLSKGAFRLLAAHTQTRALVLFTSAKSDNYRLSLVTIDLQLTGKSVVKEYSNPRRYSFFLGPAAKTHTPAQYLKDRVKDFADLQKRFSIEVVNKDFYNQIAALFTQLTGGVRGKGKKALDAGSGCLIYPGQDDQKRKEFAVRLIGRLVFCWFLKKKGSASGPLIPESLLSTAAMAQKDYYHAILEPLFFQVLNTPGDERDKYFQPAPWNAIPFLNGGLFSPQHDDYYEPGSLGLSKNIGLIKVPDAWLKELFNVFETYNFTIDENTSVDVELSIDPEMLGRIFENLLAEINPETGETARKATGSYYTPRPIVEYMVDESLKQYLLTQTGLPEDIITPLLSYSQEEPELGSDQKDALIDALHRVKVIDPACGSGAFPMGILQKILLILQKLDPDSSLWREKMLARIPDPFYRKELRKNKIPNYVHKLGIIHDCIYGVDIQPIAVEISKLRCFLSLIVDEKVDDQKDNRGIVHLPNLEFKFVCANTLIGLPQTETQAGKMKGKKVVEVKGQTSFLEDTESIDELRRLREEYLNCTGKEKAKIEKRFRSVQTEMFKHALFWQGADSQTEKLSQWDPFSHEPCHWFDPEWMFDAKEGFDIVIANPPYIFTRKMEFTDKFKKYIKTYYFQNIQSLDKTKSKSKQSGKINYFSLFIIRGLWLARDNGLISYIVPNTLLRTTTYDLTRKFILDNSRLMKILDLGAGVFSAVTASTIVFSLMKESSHQERDNNQVEAIHTIHDFSTHDYEINTIPQISFYANTSYAFNILVNEQKANLLNKISNNHEKLGVFCIDIIEGIVAHKHLIKSIKQQNSKPLLEGKNIKPYQIEKPRKHIVWDKSKIHRTRPDYLWDAPIKIVIQRISGGSTPLVAALDRDRIRTFASINNIVLKDDYQNEYKYILALLNSKLINFYYANSFSNNSQLTVNISKTYLEQLPIVRPSKKEKAIIDDFVDELFSLLESNNYSDEKTLRSQINILKLKIDQVVYKLYGLTAEEIALVEGKSS